MNDSLRLGVQDRSWIVLEDSTKNSCNFSIVSYNILADGHINNDYPYVHSNERYMAHRHSKIIEEIKRLNADIICFQEVEISYFHEKAVPDLYFLGYKGVFHLRNNVEGLAIFYLVSKFTCLNDKFCSLNNIESIFLDRIDKNIADIVKNLLLSTPGGIMMAELKFNDCNKKIIIGSVHVWFDYFKHPDVLAMQSCEAVKEITKFSNGIPFILAGDFNVEPISPAYEILKTGKLSLENKHKLENITISTDTEQQSVSLVNIFSELFTHNTDLESSYRYILGSEPEVTCCSNAKPYFPYIGCLDYIWYNSQSLLPTAVLKTVTTDVVEMEYALPNTVFPSDHILLAAKFQYKN